MKKAFRHFNFTIFVFCCLFLILSIQKNMAQDATPTPENPELKSLKDKNALLDEQKKTAESEAAIAVANKTKREAENPKPTSTPLEGKTELDAGVKIESEMLGYHALKIAAAKVTNDAKAKLGNNTLTSLAIYNSQTLKAIQSYSATTKQLNLMKEEYKAIFPSPLSIASFDGSKGTTEKSATSLYLTGNEFYRNKFKLLNKSSVSDRVISLSIGESLLGAFIDLAAFLRTDTKIAGNTFTVQESAFVSEVFRNFRSKYTATNLFYPNEFSPTVNSDKKFEILGTFEELNDFKVKSSEIIDRIDENEKKLKDELTKKDALEARGKQIPKDILEVNEQFEELDKTYNPSHDAKYCEKIPHAENYCTEKNKLQNSLRKLKKEQDEGLPAQIDSNAKAIHNLELKLSDLYNQLNLEISPDEQKNLLVRAVELQKMINEVGNKFFCPPANPSCGQTYTLDDLKQLVSSNKKEYEQIKKKLIKQAKIALGVPEAQDLDNEEKLLNPLGSEKLKAFVAFKTAVNKVLAENIDITTPRGIARVVSFLTKPEEFNLLLETGAEVEAESKFYEKQKNAVIIRLKTLNSQFDKLYQEIIKVDPNTGVNAITSFLQTEELMEALSCNDKENNCPNTYMLELRVIDVGGNNRTKKNLLTTIVTGDNVSHSGGAIVEYKLYNMNGKVTASSICYAYQDYRKPKSINSLSSGLIKEEDSSTCNETPILDKRGKKN